MRVEFDALFFRYSIQQCMDIFGSTFNAANIQSGVTQTNTNYGGYGIASSKVSPPQLPTSNAGTDLQKVHTIREIDFL